MAIEIVDFPMKNGGSFHGKMLVHQRVTVGSQWDPIEHNGRYDIPGWKVLGATPGLGHLEGSCFDDKVGSGFLMAGCLLSEDVWKTWRNV